MRLPFGITLHRPDIDWIQNTFPKPHDNALPLQPANQLDQNGIPFPHTEAARQGRSRFLFGLITQDARHARRTMLVRQPQQSPITVTAEIAHGAFKSIYRIAERQDQVLALLKDDEDSQQLTNEVNLLKQLQSLNFPVVEIYGIVESKGRHGILMQYIPNAEHMKDTGLLGQQMGRNRQWLEARLEDCVSLNQCTIHDLQKIKTLLQEHQINIDDFQFLIGEDGHVHIIDPRALDKGVNEWNIKLLDDVLAITHAKIADQSTS